jgi:uncharacterized protein YutE (UPF0331/DUF86 family)
MKISLSPAAKLHKILSDVRVLAEQNKHSDLRAREGWKRILQVESGDTIDVARALMSLVDLVREVRSLVETYEENKDEYLDGYEFIELAVFSGNLESTFYDSVKKITPELLAHLKFININLSRHTKSYGELDPADLKEISDAIDELFELVISKKMSAEAKEFFLETIESFRRAISEYRISGVKGIRNAMKFAVGGLVENREVLIRENEENPELVDRFGRAMTLVDRITSAASRGVEIVGSVMKLIDKN